MPKYTFQVNEYMDELRLIDSWVETIDASDVFKAVEDMKKAYPSNKGYDCFLIN